MRDVLRWIDRHNGAPALEILASRTGEDTPAADLLAGIVATDSREQSGIWSTASGVLAAYRTEGALASTRIAPLDMETFCAGPNTLYVCATGRRQRQFAPLVVAIMGDVRDADLRSVPRRARRPAHPPGARRGRQHRPHSRPPGHGQRRSRPRSPDTGVPAGSVPGPGPVGTGSRRLPVPLRHHRGPARHCRHHHAARPQRARRATARWPTTTVSRSVDRWGRLRPSTSVGTSYRLRLPVDAAAQGAPGQALVLGPDKAVQHVSLTPAHARAPWRDLMPPAPHLAVPEPAERGR